MQLTSIQTIFKMRQILNKLETLI